jgi:thymidylate synthase
MNNLIVKDEAEEKLITNYRLEKSHEEYKYLHLLERILDEGTVKGDRTGTGTKSIFGTQLSFDLSNSFPILTTKKVYWKGVVEELLWFIRGETDSKKLEAKGVKIWTGNTTREFLDKKGLNYPEGEIGPGYGFQWRHWGKYYNPNPDQNAIIIDRTQDGGIDQLANVINTLKKNPNDRRMIVSAWNVAAIDKMALPPCHLLYQFDVTNGRLNCQWYQRSVDTFLGLPFNISSYALLTCLIAKIVGLQPGTLTYAGGDTHLYLNHLDQAKEQVSRTPYPFPKLNIKKDIKTLEDIENLELSDLELVGYESHAPIKAEMAI